MFGEIPTTGAVFPPNSTWGQEIQISSHTKDKNMIYPKTGWSTLGGRHCLPKQDPARPHVPSRVLNDIKNPSLQGDVTRVNLETGLTGLADISGCPRANTQSPLGGNSQPRHRYCDKQNGNHRM